MILMVFKGTALEDGVFNGLNRNTAGDMARKIEKGEWPDGFCLPPERESGRRLLPAPHGDAGPRTSPDHRVVRRGSVVYVRGRSSSRVRSSSAEEASPSRCHGQAPIALQAHSRRSPRRPTP